MKKSIRATRKYVRKHRPPERGTQISVRLQRDDLADLDEWIVDYSRTRGRAPWSRPMAIRHLMRETLRAWRRKKPKAD